jgi:Flp pilus assembly pilin Flp
MAFLISYVASKTYVSLRKRQQGGQALVEYAIILILVSVVCVVVLVTNGVQLQHMFSNITCGFGHCTAPADVTPTPTPTPYCNGECRDGR